MINTQKENEYIINAWIGKGELSYKTKPGNSPKTLKQAKQILRDWLDKHTALGTCGQGCVYAKGLPSDPKILGYRTVYAIRRWKSITGNTSGWDMLPLTSTRQ